METGIELGNSKGSGNLKGILKGRESYATIVYLYDPRLDNSKRDGSDLWGVNVE